MTNSIPEGFSADNLKELLEKAPKDITSTSTKSQSKSDAPYNGATPEELIRDVSFTIQEFLSKYDNHPMAVKALALSALHDLMMTHTRVGMHVMSEKVEESGVGILRDAGKLQGSMGLLLDVYVPDELFNSDGSMISDKFEN